MVNKKTAVGNTSLEYCKKHPNVQSRTLAKMLLDEHPEIYTSVEQARASVRRCRGTVGTAITKAGAVDQSCYGTGKPKDLNAVDKDGDMPPRILIFDIETSPNMAYVWGCYKQNVCPTQMIEHTDVMCYAAKWLGEAAIFFDSREKDPDDRRCCETLWKLMDSAEMVVAHNGQGFDVKTMNTRWVEMGLQPPSPYKVIDTLKLARAQFRFPMNKLDYIARYLNIGKKTEHEGFDLWTKCLAGDSDAWGRMGEYNINDVLILEEVYLKLRAWDARHPNVALSYTDSNRRCVVCGSKTLNDLTKEAKTAVTNFPSARCANCGHVMRYGSVDKEGTKNGKNVMRNAQ